MSELFRSPLPARLTIKLPELVNGAIELPELVTGNFRSVSMDETGYGTGRKW
jgi:hypothetical protein